MFSLARITTGLLGALAMTAVPSFVLARQPPDATEMDDQAAPTASQPAPATTHLTLASVNLLGEEPDWPQRRQAIVAALSQLHPDVIALQEVVQRSDLPNQACWLAGQLHYSCHFVTADPPSHAQRRGNALLTRHEVISDAVTLLHPTEAPAVAGLVQIDVEGADINVYVARLHGDGASGKVARSEQAGDLATWIDATSGDAPSVLIGDLAVTSLQAPELQALAQHFTDAHVVLGTPDRETRAGAIDVSQPPVRGAERSHQHVLLEPGRFAVDQVTLLALGNAAHGISASLDLINNAPASPTQAVPSSGDTPAPVR